MGKPRRNSTSSDSAPKIERKIIEKNRRSRMKTLQANLVALLPKHTSKMQQVEGLPLPDQMHEAVEHIESMKKKLEILRQKKELLLRGKRSSGSCITNQATEKRPPPLIEVHEMGQNLDVVLANGIQDYSAFNDIIRSIHQHGVEIASASFARDGNSTFHVIQDKVGQSKSVLGSTAAPRKLKELVPGASSSSEVVESHELNLWDYGIDHLSDNIWGFEIPQILGASETNFGYCEEFLNIGNLFNI